MDLSLKNIMVAGGEVFVKGSRFALFFPHVCTCKKTLQEKECEYLGKTGKNSRMNIYWFNCPHCGTTFIKKTESDL